MTGRLFRKFKVFGRLIPVFKIQGLIGEGAYGYFSEENWEIGIDADLRGVELEGTCIHELFHAVLDRLHIQQQLSPAFAEVIVENLAQAVLENYGVRFKK